MAQMEHHYRFAMLTFVFLCSEHATVKAFGAGNGRIWIDDVECQGTEDYLYHCDHRDWGEHDCKHYEDAGCSCIASEGELL